MTEGRHAVIDVGSNSIKLYVADVVNGRDRKVSDSAIVSRLAKGRGEDGGLAEDAIARTARAVAVLVKRAREFGAQTITAVGTMAMRSASNSIEVVNRIRRETGISVEVIPGVEEAHYSYLGVESGIGAGSGNTCIFDVGGGSTEFVFADRGAIVSRASVAAGSRGPTDELFSSDPVMEAEVTAGFEFILGCFEGIDPRGRDLIGVGGTVTTLAAVRDSMTEFDDSRIEGSTLTRREVERQRRLYASASIEERREIPGVPHDRADVILAGSMLIESVLRIAEADSLVVTSRGVRHGVFVVRHLQSSA